MAMLRTGGSDITLLCGHFTGRITRLARPSVRPSMSIRLFLTGSYSKTKKYKNQRKINVPQSISKWSASFQLKRSKVKVTGCQKT